MLHLSQPVEAYRRQINESIEHRGNIISFDATAIINAPVITNI